MRQKLRRCETARERRIELYVQVTIIITISNHRYSPDGGYRGETEHESYVELYVQATIIITTISNQ